ncbi:MAG: hypothetical protein DHS80DRAFT_26051 [Piptocephalis tieghemiana]|nr:MAG: hypothetical protein DHS80DRAFT_26051 [Piptocephalis tieghemiana]
MPRKKRHGHGKASTSQARRQPQQQSNSQKQASQSKNQQPSDPSTKDNGPSDSSSPGSTRSKGSSDTSALASSSPTIKVFKPLTKGQEAQEDNLDTPCTIPLPPSPPPRRRPATSRRSLKSPSSSGDSGPEEEEMPFSLTHSQTSSPSPSPISKPTHINIPHDNGSKEEDEDDDEELGSVEYRIVREKKHFSLVRLRGATSSAPSSPRTSPSPRELSPSPNGNPSSRETSPSLHGMDPGQPKAMHSRRYSLTNPLAHSPPDSYQPQHQRSSSAISPSSSGSSTSSHSPPRSSPLRQFQTASVTTPGLTHSRDPEEDGMESPELVTPHTPGFHIDPPPEERERKEDIIAQSGPPSLPPRRRAQRRPTYSSKHHQHSGSYSSAQFPSVSPHSPPALTECRTDPTHWSSLAQGGGGPVSPEYIVRTLQEDMEVLAQKLIMATEARGEAEAEAEAMQDQLEDLSQSVFEEASEMVRSAKEATKRAEEENSRLTRKLQEALEIRQLRENELADLKRVLRRSLPASYTASPSGGIKGIVTRKMAGEKPKGPRGNTIAEEDRESRFEFVDIPLGQDEEDTQSISSSSSSLSSGSSFRKELQGLGILQERQTHEEESEEEKEEERRKESMVEIWGRREGRVWEEFCDFWRTGTGSAYVARVAKEEADVLVRFDGAGWWLQRRIHAAVRAGQVLLEPLTTTTVTTTTGPSTMDQRRMPPSETAELRRGEGEGRGKGRSEKRTDDQRINGGDGRKGKRKEGGDFGSQGEMVGEGGGEKGESEEGEEGRKSRVTPLRSAHPTGCELCGAGTGPSTSLLATASRSGSSCTGQMFRLSLDMEEGSSTGSSESWRVCSSCRGRLVAACEWWAWLRVVQGGLWHRDSEAAWAQSIRLRLGMWGARNEAWVGSKTRLEERESIQVYDDTRPSKASWVHGWI